MRDRRVIAVVAAGAITVVALLVIVVLGVRPLPDFSALAGSNETGFVAYAVDEGGHQMSARIVDLSTAETIEVNLPDNGEVAGWDDDGNLMLVQWGSTVRIKHLDPVTGEQVGTTERIQEYAGPDRDDVWIDHVGGHVVLERADGATASFEAPSSYHVTSASSMGDDRVAFIDEGGRVAVCEAGEDVTPVQVADDAEPGWWVTARS